ncbi:MAG: SusD/RagB family nutrient-binding outer membrane lipoprotein [Candidatus Cryptobacteroides sp.]
MKTINRIMAAAVALVMCGCTDLDELNVNPAATSTMNPNLILPSVQYYEACTKQQMVRYMIYPGGWNNHFTGYSGMVNYGAKGVYSAGYATRLWTEYYPNPAKNVMALLMNSSEGSNIHAAGRVMRVETFMKLTDAYGDIPFSESGTAYSTGVISPKYDKQEDIYNEFFKELDAAVKEFSENGDNLTNDLYFGGDITKWKKYANSLRLRAAMRLVKVNPEKAKQEAEAAIAAGVMTSNDDIAYISCDNNRDNLSAGNAFANFVHLYQGQLYITNELVDALKGGQAQEDPRFRIIAASYLEEKYLDAAKPTDITDLVYNHYNGYQAVPAQCARTKGDDCTHPDFSLSDINLDINGTSTSVSQHFQRLRASTLISSADAPYIKMSYAEVLLLQAEAKVRYGIGSESAESLYKKAIEAGCKQFTLFKADVDNTKVSQFVAAQSLATGQELELINTQLWLQYIFNPLEAWANTRRTDGLPEKYAKYYNYYPTVNTTSGNMPHRLPYPATEQTRNQDNYNMAVERLRGTDDWNQRVWWDCKLQTSTKK